MRRFLARAALLVVLASVSAAAALDRRAGPPGAVGFLDSSRPDVLLVTIDTLRADSLGFAGNKSVETPVLDRLAAQGRVFGTPTRTTSSRFRPTRTSSRASSPTSTGSATTPDSASILRPDSRDAAEGEGYATGAFVGAFPLDSRFGLSRGFDVYDDRYPRGRTPLDFEMPERPASEVVPAALAWWNEKRRPPRFLWVHLYDPHAPYRPPAPFAERYRANEYLGEVAATDAALAPLLDPLTSGARRRRSSS